MTLGKMTGAKTMRRLLIAVATLATGCSDPVAPPPPDVSFLIGDWTFEGSSPVMLLAGSPEQPGACVGAAQCVVRGSDGQDYGSFQIFTAAAVRLSGPVDTLFTANGMHLTFRMHRTGVDSVWYVNSESRLLKRAGTFDDDTTPASVSFVGYPRLILRGAAFDVSGGGDLFVEQGWTLQRVE